MADAGCGRGRPEEAREEQRRPPEAEKPCRAPLQARLPVLRHARLFELLQEWHGRTLLAGNESE